MKAKAPRHFNPLPCYGLRVRLSRTETAVRYLLRHGATPEQVPALLYMADVQARRYLGRPVTDVAWTRSMVTRSMVAR